MQLSCGVTHPDFVSVPLLLGQISTPLFCLDVLMAFVQESPPPEINYTVMDPNSPAVNIVFKGYVDILRLFELNPS
ncbi:hypothetical protein L1887_36178 [Cichorium endivia]|nr:hypothetical protein L1887_36178 [Cichorium endivia]